MLRRLSSYDEEGVREPRHPRPYAIAAPPPRRNRRPLVLYASLPPEARQRLYLAVAARAEMGHDPATTLGPDGKPIGRPAARQALRDFDAHLANVWHHLNSEPAPATVGGAEREARRTLRRVA
jgi:hypothetical protein